MQFIEHQVGELTVSQRQKDGYINATKLAKAYQKKTGKYKNANSWFEKDRTHESLELLSKETGLEVEELVQKRQEIWIHHQLAISFAMWLSPEFEMMVSKWVYQWILTGKEPVQPSTTDLAFEAYNRGETSLGKLAELLDVPIEEAKEQLKKRNAPLDLGVSSEDELLSDIENA